MDPRSRELFLAAPSRLTAARGAPNLLYVTHHVEAIVPIFAQTLALRDGIALRIGPTREVLTPATMKELYDVSMPLLHRKGRYWPIRDRRRGRVRCSSFQATVRSYSSSLQQDLKNPQARHAVTCPDSMRYCFPALPLMPSRLMAAMHGGVRVLHPCLLSQLMQ